MTTTSPLNCIDVDPSNPSLKDLIWLTQKYENYFTDLDLTVLTEYQRDSHHFPDGKYFLHGQLPVLPTTLITKNLLEKAETLNNNRLYEYGGPCNSFEVASIERSKRLYQNLILIIERYEPVYHEIMYAPGTGIEYVKAKKRFEESTGAHKE
jgi:hypothetical protein